MTLFSTKPSPRQECTLNWQWREWRWVTWGGSCPKIQRAPTRTNCAVAVPLKGSGFRGTTSFFYAAVEEQLKVTRPLCCPQRD
jgi:hypothetical protein